MTNDARPQDKSFAGLGPQPFERLARSVMEKSLARRGFASADLITNWSMIVGADIARMTEPERLKVTRGKELRGATLVIKVDRAALLEAPMWQPLILERVNGYMGLGTVARIVFSPADLADSPGAGRESAAHSSPAQSLDEALRRLERNVRS